MHKGLAPVMLAAIIVSLGLFSITASVLYVTVFSVKPAPQQEDTIDDSPPITTGGGSNYAASLSASGLDAIYGNGTDINAELWSATDNKGYKAEDAGTVSVGETRLNNAITSLSTNLPNNYNGYIMIGNDNYQSTTDRGAEYYYTKVPVSWSNVPGLVSQGTNLKVYMEGVPTWTGKDASVTEATTNITFTAAGETNTLLSVKIQVSVGASLGNPDPLLEPFTTGNRRLAVCNNESTGGLIDPVGTKPSDGATALGFIPGNISSLRPVGCYVLGGVTWLDDDPKTANANVYEFDYQIKLKAGQQVATIADSTFLTLWDLTWCKDDSQVWKACWSDESATSTPGDAGIASIVPGAFTGDKQIWFNR